MRSFLGSIIFMTIFLLFHLLSLYVQLVYVSGQYKLQENNSFLTAIVHPVSPPSILEIRMEGNMFVTHYALDMRCTFFDGRLVVINFIIGLKCCFIICCFDQSNCGLFPN